MGAYRSISHDARKEALMTERQDLDTTPPEEAAALPDEPIPDAGTDAESDGATAGARARELLGQLEGKIQDAATAAAPVARQIGAKAAELTASAATKAGPLAHRAADLTTDVGQRVAGRAQSVAADLRTAPEAEPVEGAASEEPAADAPEEPQAPSA
jgi:hypothetical protein